jgi:hypothetical protein
MFTTSWEADRDDLPDEFRARVSYFLRRMKTIFYQCRIGPSNLLPYQKYLLRILCQSEWWIVVPTDKNLGPAIMDRTKYIFLIYRDHLSDESTCRRLSEQDAYAAIADVRSKIQKLLVDEQSAFSNKDLTFLQRSLARR